MGILKEIMNRKSPLVFRENNVERQKIDTLIEAARWAPSCFNKQPWKYVFVQKKDLSRKNLEAALAPGNGWAKRAPYLVAVGANPDDACKTNGLPYYAYDVGLSVMTLTIEAEHQGLRVHQMAGWNEKKVAKALGFPSDYRIVVVFALGYEGEAKRFWDKLQERVKERLAESRKRNPQTDNFFFGALNRTRARCLISCTSCLKDTYTESAMATQAQTYSESFCGGYWNARKRNGAIKLHGVRQGT